MKKQIHLLLIVVAIVISCAQVSASPPLSDMTPDAALNLLKQGNARYVSGAATAPGRDRNRRNTTSLGGQHPFATVIACSDSRVPVEILFDQGIGDLFVVRVAGNVAGVYETGSVEYGVKHLSTPALVVLGHTSCGAVTAVVENSRLQGSIPPLLEKILPVVASIREKHPLLAVGALVDEAVKANVWRTIEDLFRASPILREQVGAGASKVMGAVYDIKTGKVDWIGAHPEEKNLIESKGVSGMGAAGRPRTFFGERGRASFNTPPSSPTEIRVGLYLLGVNKISEPSNPFSEFEVSMFMGLAWMDHRLAFEPEYGLTKRKIFEGNEAKAALTRIFWPDIVFRNEKSSRQTEHLWLGIHSNGAVEYAERFTVSISADFDLRKFPFDSQELIIGIESFPWDVGDVVFVESEEKTGWEEKQITPEWTITGIHSRITDEKEIRSDRPFSKFIFTVHTERESGYYIIKILAPLLLIVILSWSVFWMFGESATGRLSRCFVALLTIVAFHRIVSDNLPKISFLTFMDCIVFLAYGFMSVTIIETVIVHTLVQKEKEEKALHVDKAARWMIPSGFFLLLLLLAFFFSI